MNHEHTAAGTPAVTISWECPRCGAPLVLRRRKADGAPFTGCSGYPRCRFSEDADEREQRLARDLAAAERRLLDALEREAELRARVYELEAAMQNSTTQRSTTTPDLARQLRGLVSRFHPDRWPGSPVLAHEIAVALNDLRREVVT